MREIKFRGKDKSGNWHYGDLVLATDRWYKHKAGGFHREWIAERTFSNGGFINLAVRHCVTSKTIGQFTGLRDKNGVEIYEGDVVVRRDLTFGTEKVCEVVYNSEIASFRLHYQNNVYTERYPFLSSDTYNDGKCTVECKYEYEVIGNKYDNPDLLYI